MITQKVIEGYTTLIFPCGCELKIDYYKRSDIYTDFINEEIKVENLQSCKTHKSLDKSSIDPEKIEQFSDETLESMIGEDYNSVSFCINNLIKTHQWL